MRDLLCAFALATLALAPLACSTPAALGGPGAPCSVVTDCAEGLVCIPKPNNARECSNDLAAIQFVEEAGTSTAAATQSGANGGAPGDAAVVADGSASAAPVDSAGATSPNADAALPPEAASVTTPDAAASSAGDASGGSAADDAAGE